jgi:DUF4097 and DUF4098 domain-containing protein YvlB
MFEHSCRALVIALTIAASGCVINVNGEQVVVREEKQFKVAPGAEVTLETWDGSIRVHSWDQPQVRIEIEKRGPDRQEAAALEVRASQDGNRVRVEAPRPKVVREVIGINATSPSVSYVVRLPQNVKLTATTGDGSIAVENVTGSVSLRSGDGSIRADRITGDLTARTDDGSVTVGDVNGRITLETGELAGRVEDLQVRTGDGAIDVEAGEGSAMKADWKIATGDGSISLRLPRGFNGQIDAESDDGRVSSDIDGLDSRNEDDRGTLRGRLGSGGHTVSLRSGDGSISVLNR